MAMEGREEMISRRYSGFGSVVEIVVERLGEDRGEGDERVESSESLTSCLVAAFSRNGEVGCWGIEGAG